MLACKRAQSLQAVDRDVADIGDHLQQNGQIDNTYIIFTSDNGFHLGQHRMPSGKQTVYETDIHLPLLVGGITEGGMCETSRATSIWRRRSPLAACR